MTKRYVAMGLSALTAGAVVAGTAAVTSAGAAEERDLVVCNWTDSGMMMDTVESGDPADRSYHVAMAGPGCAPVFRPAIGQQVVIVIAGWDQVPHETHWWMPGQNMRLDITGDVNNAQYDPTYW